MTKPIPCGHAPGSVEECAFCRLFRNHEHYRKKWGPSDGSTPPTLPDIAALREKIRVPKCTMLGLPVLRRSQCWAENDYQCQAGHGVVRPSTDCRRECEGFEEE